MTAMMNKVCAFTGHRPNKLPWRYDENDTRCLALKALCCERSVERFEIGRAALICDEVISARSAFIMTRGARKRVPPENRAEKLRNMARASRGDHIPEERRAGSAVRINGNKALPAVIKSHNHNDFYSALNF